MNEKIFIIILFIHFIADFALQTHEQAMKKSSNEKYLFYHVLIYSLTWFLVIILFAGFKIALMFSVITFIFHFLTDYFTSRGVRCYFDKADYHNGFLVIGFDQILHYIQLIYTFKILLRL